MIDYFLLMEGKKILERELKEVAKEWGAKINTTLATEFYFDFLRSKGKRLKKYSKNFNKRVFQSRKDAIAKNEDFSNPNKIFAMDAFKIYIAERKGIGYDIDRKGNLVFEREVLKERQQQNNNQDFEEETEELPNIDD